MHRARRGLLGARIAAPPSSPPASPSSRFALTSARCRPSSRSSFSSAGRRGAPISIPQGWSARERAVAERHHRRRASPAHVAFSPTICSKGAAPGSRGSELAMRYMRREYERLGLEAGRRRRRLPAALRHRRHARRKVVAPPVAARRQGDARAQAPASTRSSSPACRRSGGACATPRWSSSATASPRPSRSGTTSRTSTCAARSLLVMNNDPEDDPALFAGKTRLYYGRWNYKYEEAARHGAAGAIIIHTEPSAGYPWQVVQTSWTRRAVRAAGRAASRASRSRCGRPRTRARAASPQLGGQRSRRAAPRAPRSATSGRCRSASSCRSALKTTLTRARRPPTCSACCPAAIRKLAERGGGLHARTTITSASREPQGRRRRSTTARSTTPRAWPRCSAIAEALAALEPRPQALDPVRRRRRRGVGPARLANISASTRSCRAGPHRRQHQHRRHQHLGAHPRRRLHRPRQVVARRRRRRGRARAGRARSSPTSSPTSGYFYRSRSVQLRARSACPAIYLEGGHRLRRPRRRGGGASCIEEYDNERYHQPSDQIDAELEPRRRGRRRAAHGGGAAAHRRRAEDARVEAGRRVRGGAQESARGGNK